LLLKVHEFFFSCTVSISNRLKERFWWFFWKLPDPGPVYMTTDKDFAEFVLSLPSQAA
jgi:hypothetical protein